MIFVYLIIIDTVNKEKLKIQISEKIWEEIIKILISNKD